MTVQQLIDTLKGFDPDTSVLTEIGEPIEVVVEMAGEVIVGRRGFIGEEE